MKTLNAFRWTMLLPFAEEATISWVCRLMSRSRTGGPARQLDRHVDRKRAGLVVHEGPKVTVDVSMVGASAAAGAATTSARTARTGNNRTWAGRRMEVSSLERVVSCLVERAPRPLQAPVRTLTSAVRQRIIGRMLGSAALEFRCSARSRCGGEGQPLRLGGERQRALLALLLLHANEVVPSERLDRGAVRR